MKVVIILGLILFSQVHVIFAQSAPETLDDSYRTALNTALDINQAEGLLQNDVDADGDNLNIVSFIANGIVYNAGQTVNTTGGSVLINADGSFTYNPSADFDGTVPVIAYLVSDGTFTSVGHLYLTISGIGPAVARNNYDTADINTTLNVPAPGLLGNDSFEDEDTINVESVTINQVNYNVGESINIGGGSMTIFADGSFTFVPTPGYTGPVTPVQYTISDGNSSSTAALFLTVEETEDLIEIQGVESCNQGYTTDGTYKINYTLNLRSLSTARDYHSSSLIYDVDLIKDLNSIYGNGCVVVVDDFEISTSTVIDFIANPYPRDFDLGSVNQDFLDGDAADVFTPANINSAILFPRQNIFISYCIEIDPFCDGRPNPTPSGSGVDFNTLINVTSSRGNSEIELLLTDFHTSEAIITAGLYIQETAPIVNPDGTYGYENYVILTNNGSATANNVNFNMGLGSFLDNGVVFSELTLSQIGNQPVVNVNNNFDGDINTLLLEPNTSLAPGESIVIEIFHLTEPFGFNASNIFAQVNPSMTQGDLDSFDEDTPENRRLHSYALWEDSLGSHLDRYYSSATSETPGLNDQCDCTVLSLFLGFTSATTCEKQIININTAPNGILEHEEYTFQFTFTNTSAVVDLNNLQLTENLFAICEKSPYSVSTPEIISSTATTDPNINPNFDGDNDINIFDGTSGLLMTGESITVELTAVFYEDCIGFNTVDFSATDPSGSSAGSSSTVPINAFTDTDNDGITNVNDIDDDNDTILDIEESGGLDPIGDDDNDLIPNYRDLDYGADENNDGIVDIFDFDGDGVPNHLDLDSDNDGIFDIYEVKNSEQDTSSNGRTNNLVGLNGLDNDLESNDSINAVVTYVITATDADINPDYLDIDSDADGIVDNIEAQPTGNYIPPDNIIDENGVDSAYTQGLTPVDTDADGMPDFIDLNSDNDIRDDFIEGWDFDSDGTPETVASNIDADNDGLDDAYDNDTSQVNPTNGQVPTDFPNIDYDVTPERDWRENMAVVVLISDASAEEGNALEFIISLVRYIDNTLPMQSPFPTEITLFTSDGADNAGEFNVAVSPFDYTAQEELDIVIPPLSDTFSISISSIDDIISELDELFTLSASITSENTINTEAEGIGTIIDNEPLPTVTLNDDTVFEGEDLMYNLSINIPSSSPVIINLYSLDISATANLDYEPISTVFVIEGTTDPENASLELNFSIATFTDNLNEPDEEVLALIGNVTSNNVNNPNLDHTGTILDIDPDPLVVISNDEVNEGATLVFTIRLLNGEGQLMGNYLPIDFELETLDVTTTFNLDYLYYNAFDFIPAGESTLTIQIPTLNDNLNEANEFMNLSATVISGPVANNSNVLLGLGTIIDNDIPNLFTPNNDGQSDVFRIGNLENYPDFKLIIFDRWGGEIYNYNNNGNQSPRWWDGTRNGNPVIEGVYFYELDYNDGVTKPKTGFIQLAR